jgi:23S rRNA (adenine-N6)-dimethyltransferase
LKRLAHYSQYFLRSPQLVKELVGHSSISKNDDVIDIGAGSGVISSVLATRCRSVTAIEFEPRVVSTLRENMREYPNVTVYQGDFLTMALPEKPYKIFANIPFHLSSPILHKITEAKNPPVATYLIVQKQFADKLLGDSDHFTSQLGMIIGPEFSVRIRRPLRRDDFWPHPNVDTVLLEIVHRDEPLIGRDKLTTYKKLIVDCFSDPKIFAKMPIAEVGLRPNIKPSQMTLAQWVRLFKAATER